MLVFLFRILPLIILGLLIAGVILISLGFSRGSKGRRAAGMACVALFVLLLTANVLLILARV